MRTNKTSYTPSTVAVIVDTRDGRQDRVMPATEAMLRYKAGDLSWDITNSKYCVPTNNQVPNWMTQYEMKYSTTGR